MLEVARSHPEIEPPGGEHVDHGVVLGHAQRMVERQHDDAGAEPDAARALSRRGEEDGRARNSAVLVKVVLRHPEGIESPLVSGLRLLQHLGVELRGRPAELGRVVVHHREEAEPHQPAAPSSPLGGRSSSRASASCSPSLCTSSRRVAR